MTPAIPLDPTTLWVTAFTTTAVTVGLIAQIVLQVMARIDNARAAKQAKEDAGKVKLATEKVAYEVRKYNQENADALGVAAEKMEDIAKVGRDTHTLTNSNMGAQLQLSMAALKRVAQLTGHPDDVAAADLAKQALERHEAKQTIVDDRADIEK